MSSNEAMSRGLHPERTQTTEPARADGQDSRVSMPFCRCGGSPCTTWSSIGRQGHVFSLNPVRWPGVVGALKLLPMVSRDWAAIAAAAALAVIACYGVYALVWLLVHRSSVVSVIALVAALAIVAALR